MSTIRRWLWAALLCAMASGCGARAATLEHAPDDQRLEARELYARGVMLADQGDLTRAEQYLAAAQRAGYDERATTRALVGVCVRASRLRSALLYAEPSLRAHPGDVALRKLVAAVQIALGDADEAERQLRTVLASAPNDADAHYLLALVLSGTSEARDTDQAREHFARYLAAAPAGPHAEEARAQLREKPPSVRPAKRGRAQGAL